MRRFNIGELIYFLTLCFLNIFLIYLIVNNKVEFYVGKKMILYIYFAVLIISLMIIFQFSNIFTTKTSENIVLKNFPLILTLVLGIISINNIGSFKHILLNDKIVNSSHDHKCNIDDYSKLINNKTIIINDDNVELLEHIAMNPREYLGYKITMNGFVCKEKYLSNNQFVLGKVVMTCCRADASIFGMVVQYNDAEKLKENEEIKVEGVLDSTIIYDNGKEYILPLIIVNKLI